MKNRPLHIAIIILVILLAGSCGTKKKLSERQSETNLYSNQKDVVLTSIEIENARILTDSVGKRTTFTPVDPGKPSRVGNTTFENTTITQEDVTLHREETRADSTTTSLQDQSQEEKKEVRKSRSTDSDVKRQSPWVWLAIAGAVGLIAFLWIRFGRRTN